MTKSLSLSLRTLTTFLLLGILLSLSGCGFLKSRDWPKFWKAKPATNTIFTKEFGEGFANIPPPIDLTGSEGSLIPDTNPGVETAVLPLAGRPPSSDTPVLYAELQTIYFEHNSYELSAEMMAKLESNARWILDNAPDREIKIEGHCDERGTAEYNMSLGTNRADEVRLALANMGVNPNLLSPVSYGEERPAPGADGHDETSWSQNRRVQFLVY